MTATVHEYAFDVALTAVVRVKAASEAEARAALEATVDAMEPTGDWIEGFNYANTWCKVTEVSLSDNLDGVAPFEIDGVGP